MTLLYTFTWLIRAAHVISAMVWLGGYLAVLTVAIPLLRRHTSPALDAAARGAVRVGTYAGTATLAFGLALVSQTRGFDQIARGEWGVLVLSCLGIAVAVLGLGDSALVPALRKLSKTGEAGPARRLAGIGIALLVLAELLMTRALYVD